MDNTVIDMVFGAVDKKIGTQLATVIIGSKVFVKLVDKYKKEFPVIDVVTSLEKLGVELKPLTELFFKLQCYRANNEAQLIKDIKVNHTLSEDTAFALIERASLANVVTGVLTSAVGQLGGLLAMFNFKK